MITLLFFCFTNIMSTDGSSNIKSHFYFAYYFSDNYSESVMYTSGQKLDWNEVERECSDRSQRQWRKTPSWSTVSLSAVSVTWDNHSPEAGDPPFDDSSGQQQPDAAPKAQCLQSLASPHHVLSRRRCIISRCHKKGEYGTIFWEREKPRSHITFVTV